MSGNCQFGSSRKPSGKFGAVASADTEQGCPIILTCQPSPASTDARTTRTRIDVETKLGTSEVWEIVSVRMAHPFHMQGALFRILTLVDKPPPDVLERL